jgi:hypothetical protein
MAVAWQYARRADWRLMTCRPGRAVVMSVTGLSDATVKRWTCWMLRHGLLGELERGRAAKFRPGPLQAEGGRASVYLLCVPSSAQKPSPEPARPPAEHVPVDESDPPTFLGFSLKKDPNAGARANQPRPLRGPDHRREANPETPPWPRTRVAGTRAELLELAARLKLEAPALQPLTLKHLRSLLRPWISRPELCWSVQWLIYAINHTPDGTARTWTTSVRAPSGWLRSRMAAWLDPAGQPLASPGVQLAAAERTRAAAEAATRAERAARVAQLAAERAFGDQLRAAVGDAYPALVDAALARRHLAGPGRRLPTAAVDALVRQAVRDRLDQRPYDPAGFAEAIRAVAAQLITAGSSGDDGSLGSMPFTSGNIHDLQPWA